MISRSIPHGPIWEAATQTVRTFYNQFPTPETLLKPVEFMGWHEAIERVLTGLGSGAAALGLKHLYDGVRHRQRVIVGVHTGVKGGVAGPQVFLNVANRSPADVEITRVWFEDGSADVEVSNPERPLPRRLRPEESWETWCPLSLFKATQVERLGRVRLSSGKVFRSKPRRDVAPYGRIPGG